MTSECSRQYPHPPKHTPSLFRLCQDSLGVLDSIIPIPPQQFLQKSIRHRCLSATNYNKEPGPPPPCKLSVSSIVHETLDMQLQAHDYGLIVGPHDPSCSRK